METQVVRVEAQVQMLPAELVLWVKAMQVAILAAAEVLVL
jgi:hypothetical protein